MIRCGFNSGISTSNFFCKFNGVHASRSSRLLTPISPTSASLIRYQFSKMQTRNLQLKGYKHYYNQFKKSPGSYLTSFLILHELTAIVPVAGIFGYLSYIETQLIDLKKLNPEVLEMASKKAKYVLGHYFGYDASKLDLNSKTFTNLVVAYGAVKLLAPVRLFASAALTPSFAKKLINPLVKFFKKR